MITQLVTAPVGLPVSLDEAKAHLYVTISTDDTIITRYIRAAVAVCEQILQRKLITQTWRAFYGAWPAMFVLPFGDVQEVTHIKYTDDEGTETTLSDSVYAVNTISKPGRIVLLTGESWPSETLHQVNPIEVQFVTGYGDTSSDVPEDIRNAVLLTVGHFYANRESYLVNDSNKAVVEEIPMTARALLMPHRMWGAIL